MTRPNGRPIDGLQRVDDQPNRLGVKLWLGYKQCCGLTFALPTQGLITCTAQSQGIDKTIRSVGSVTQSNRRRPTGVSKRDDMASCNIQS